jgi:hypothetical protein
MVPSPTHAPPLFRIRLRTCTVSLACDSVMALPVPPASSPSPPKNLGVGVQSKNEHEVLDLAPED